MVEMVNVRYSGTGQSKATNALGQRPMQARAYAARGLVRRGAPGHVTGDFGPRTGALRLDYVLPSIGLAVAGGGVFWPPAASPDAALAGASDHRLVWIDLRNPAD